MKKQLITILTVIALVVTLVVPSFGADGGSWDPGGNTIPGGASLFLGRADGELANGSQTNNNGALSDGYFYIQTRVYLDGENGTKHNGSEMVELIGYNDSTLDNIVSMEEKSGNDWVDVTSALMNNQRSFSGVDHIKKTYRIKVSGDVQLSLQYKVLSETTHIFYTSEMKYIQIADGNYYFTMYEANVSTAAPTEETSEETSTVAPSTVEPSTEPTTVAPSTAEPTAEPSTVAPSTEPSTAPTTVAPSTEPSTAPSTAPTTQPTTAPTTKPTTQPTTVVTTTPDPTYITVTAPTTTPETTPDYTTYTAPAPSNTTVVPTGDVTTKGQVAKAPGKATIKKVWKKKKSAKKIKVKVKAVKGAKGYEFSVYKKKKNAKKHFKAIVVKYTTKVKYTIKSKKLKKKKKLFVVARAYKVSGDGTKVFGPYSKIKKVKVK